MSKSKVVVVFPVYNGAKTLEKSLQCIADQDLPDFRAIILENQSTDDTLEIANQFCAKDDRFTVVRNEQHLDMLDNLAKAARIGAAEGEYFCLRACDDESSLDFLSTLVTSLDGAPTKLLAAGATKRIRDGHVRRLTPNKNVIEFQQMYRRGKVPRNLTFPAEWFYGVYRSAAIEILMRRWFDLGTPWCFASYVVAEFVVRDLVVYVEGPTYIFYEGSGSEQKYGAAKFKDKLHQRMAYTLGCYRLKEQLPKASLLVQLRLFAMFWNDARRKTRYKLLWIF
ncbi:glycosyltransferase family 2 protein [Sinorhizobium meliloti WSM1022]|jgi:glycosyltransferase involved in cell wall biosynthesis|uniref:glycosyltransferase family 2 protein n=1 Tax=Rhizobium meliloti TaxID=382 RepID=UPI000482A102|nr:glycosyltransferase family 2 protein [Sinorhizobium meliloti]ASQ03716.1 glycosyltransferase family 2 protein [Sinorhizobium meliloti]MCO6423407.1 glycosyltransferase [Sinorhizobium meliloti]MDW9408081.1 glycosyltransferase [Sinorhizobium meliloti]MDW9444750.1 glycosyltransferase [Sinorhizobium meliloti]MDW9453556.1 glycosyltransferase [Sinorhizobium meliloti]